MLDYYVSTSSFAKNCENKFRPQLHCNGQCVLMKKLREQETKEQRVPERKSENKSEVLAPDDFYTSTDIYFIERLPLLFLYYPGAILSEYSNSIFHPPDAC